VRSVLTIFLISCVVLLCVFTFWVLCCDARYDLHIVKRKAHVLFMLFVFVCRKAHVLFTLFVFVCRKAHVLFTLFVFVCRKAHVLFMLFVFVCRKAHVLFTLFVFVCRKAHVLFTLFVLVCVRWCPTHIVLSFCFYSSCVSCIVHFWFPFGIL
jgi:hypothetical protein